MNARGGKWADGREFYFIQIIVTIKWKMECQELDLIQGDQSGGWWNDLGKGDGGLIWEKMMVTWMEI